MINTLAALHHFCAVLTPEDVAKDRIPDVSLAALADSTDDAISFVPVLARTCLLLPGWSHGYAGSTGRTIKSWL